MNEHDDLTGLDDVLGPLRSAATPAELANEHATMERMLRAHRSGVGGFVVTPRRAKVATLVAAGVLAFGGMAAASPSLLGTPPPVPLVMKTDEEPAGDPPLDPLPAAGPVVAAKTDEVPVIEVPAIDAPVDTPPLIEVPVIEAKIDDTATAFDETACLPGNHGATVSAVANGEFPADVAVADAAKSSCGKDEQAKPKDDHGKPKDEQAKPKDDHGKPKDEQAKPKDEQAKPKDEAPKPKDEAPKPKPEAPKPKPEAPKPEAPKPPAPTPEAPKPPAPTPEAPKPEAPTPQPTVPEVPAPGDGAGAGDDATTEDQ